MACHAAERRAQRPGAAAGGGAAGPAATRGVRPAPAPAASCMATFSAQTQARAPVTGVPNTPEDDLGRGRAGGGVLS